MDETISGVQLFSHTLFGNIRAIDLNGSVRFVGVDVARALEYANPSKAVIDHCKGVSKLGIPSHGGTQETNVISEGDLYRLIVKAADQSKSEHIRAKAEQFEHWIFDDVLPTIRKTGGYVANEDIFLDTYLPHADEQTRMTFKATLMVVRKQNEQIAIMKPKAQYFDALVERNLLTSLRDTAKELQVKEREFVRWLIDNGYLYRDQKQKLKPYAQYVPELFNLKEWERNTKAGTQTLITPKGRETFRLLIGTSKETTVTAK